MSLAFPCGAETFRLGTVDDHILADVGSKVLTEAYAKLNINVEVIRYPALRSLLVANKGQVDGELGRIVGMQSHYENLIMIPIPVSVLRGTVFVNDSDPKMKSWEIFGQGRVGILRGLEFSAFLTQGLEVQIADNPKQLMGLLTKGRVDMVLAELNQGLETLKDLPGSQIKALNPPLIAAPMYHYLNKRHQDLAPKITAALLEMHEAGRIRAINDEFDQKIRRQHKVGTQQ